MAKQLEFNMKFKDYELRACPRALVRLREDEPNVTIDFIKWEQDSTGRKYCYSIGYFWYDEHEPSWELNFVGSRFTEIPQEDIKPVWQMLKLAYGCLTAWSEEQEDA